MQRLSAILEYSGRLNARDYGKTLAPIAIAASAGVLILFVLGRFVSDWETVAPWLLAWIGLVSLIYLGPQVRRARDIGWPALSAVLMAPANVTVVAAFLDAALPADLGVWSTLARLHIGWLWFGLAVAIYFGLNVWFHRSLLDRPSKAPQ